MAEVIGLAASIIAVVQLADRVATVCRFFIETVDGYPRDLHLIHVEIGSLKVIFEDLSLLREEDPADSATLKKLRGSDGPVEGCRKVMTDLDRLFPTLHELTEHDQQPKGARRRKLERALAALAWPFKVKKAHDMLNEIQIHKSTINTAFYGQLLQEFQEVRRKLDEACASLDRSQQHAVFQWFESTNPSPLHNTAKRLYEPTTGDWVFKTKVWEDWIGTRTPTRAIWLHGIPGAGKTVLMGHIIENIQRICKPNSSRTPCVYYYCYHGHNQDESVPFLRWLVSQLLREAKLVPLIAWDAHKRATEPDTMLLLDILQVILESFDTVYVAIDALDESQDRRHILDVLADLMTDPRFEKIQLLVSSREYHDIQIGMCPIAQALSMSNTHVEKDIRIYVAAKIKSEAKFREWPPDLRTEVEEGLSTRAKGMFRWTVCQLDILRRLKYQSKIRAALTKLPETLDETYERIFSHIEEEERDIVRHTLHWVCFHDHLWKGRVPLAAESLVQAYLAFHGCTPNDCLHNIETLKDICGCLVTFREHHEAETESGTPPAGSQEKDQPILASVAHYTVREFLESERALRSVARWAIIEQNVVFRHILKLIFEYAETTSLTVSKETKAPGPLLIGPRSNLHEYCSATAVCAVYYHEDLFEPQLAFRFLDPSSAHFKGLKFSLKILSHHHGMSTILRNFSFYQFWVFEWSPAYKRSKTPLLISLILAGTIEPIGEELVKSTGSFHLARTFIRGQDLGRLLRQDLFCSNSTCFISGFSSLSNGNAFEILADVGLLGGKILDFVQSLVVEIAEISCYLTNILPRILAGSDETSSTDVRRLLRLGASPNPDGLVSPLQIACLNGKYAIVEILLEAGANPNNTGNKKDIKWGYNNSRLTELITLHGQSPLHITRAFQSESEDDGKIEKLLLEYNAIDIDVSDKYIGFNDEMILSASLDEEGWD